MTIEEQINIDFMAARKSNERAKKTLLGVIKGEIQTQKGRGVEINDAVVFKIVRKMEKSLKEINDKDAKRELEFLEAYLPNLLSESEIKKILKKLLNESPNANVGMIMGFFNRNYSGLVDNTMLSETIKATNYENFFDELHEFLSVAEVGRIGLKIYNSSDHMEYAKRFDAGDYKFCLTYIKSVKGILS